MTSLYGLSTHGNTYLYRFLGYLTTRKYHIMLRRTETRNLYWSGPRAEQLFGSNLGINLAIVAANIPRTDLTT